MLLHLHTDNENKYLYILIIISMSITYQNWSISVDKISQINEKLDM